MIYIVFLFFLTLLFITWHKYWAVSSYLVGIYTFSLLLSIKQYTMESDFTMMELSFVGSILYVLLLLLFFLPYMRETPRIDGSLSNIQKKRFSIVGYASSLFIILGMLLMFNKIREVSSLDFSEVRSAVYEGEASSNISNYSGIEKIGSVILGWCSGLSYVFLILFFYSYVYIKKKIILKICLFVASLSATYLGLMVAGRTKIMYWAMFAGLCLVVFYPLMNEIKKRNTKVMSAIIAIPVVTYFLAVSIIRTISTGRDTSDFLSDYIGMPYLKFNEFWIEYTPPAITLDRVFPFSSFLLGTNFDLENYRSMIESKTGMNIGIFYTMLGDFMVDLGALGMVCLSCIYFIIAKHCLKRSTFSLYNLMIFAIIVQIPLHGLFYYSFWQPSSTFCVILTLVMANYIKSGRII